MLLNFNISGKGDNSAIVLVAVLPDYRREFVSELRRMTDVDLRIVSGDVHMDHTVRSAPHDGVETVQNRAFIGRRLLWQRGTIGLIMRPHTLVVDLNPRSLTTWFALMARSPWPARRTLVWGHVHPRRGKDARTAWLRRMVRRCSDGVISYTWGDARDLSTERSSQTVWVAANGLYRAEELGWSPDSNRFRAVYVGRLEAEKRPSLAIEAFARARGTIPHDSVLTIVGTGSLESELHAQVVDLNLEGQVEFLGHITDRTRLQEIYDESVVALSPGYGGLSITQSLGFGVPVLVAGDEPHAPEIELVTFGTGRYFKSRDATDLALKLQEFFDPGVLSWDHAAIVETVKARYSATAMAGGFADALSNRGGAGQ